MNIFDWFAEKIKPPYPTVKYPTILEGEIWGPVRCESFDGGEVSEMFIHEDHKQDQSVQFKNYGPFFQDGKWWFVTHLQFKSPKGWIKTDPEGYHWWNMSHLKETYTDGVGLTTWVSGSERGWYFRKPWSWRVDQDGWTFTKGFFGRRFD